MKNEETSVEIFLEQINILENDFNDFTKNIYNKYEKLIANLMIAKGCSNGESLQFRIPLAMLDDGIVENKSKGCYDEDSLYGLDYFDYEPNKNNLDEKFISNCCNENFHEESPVYFNVNYPNIWRYLNNKKVELLNFSNIGTKFVELNYIFTLLDKIQKTASLKIAKIEYIIDIERALAEKAAGKIIPFKDEDLRRGYTERIILDETEIPETKNLLFNLYTPITIPDIFHKLLKTINVFDIDKHSFVENTFNQSPFCDDDFPL